MFAQVNGRKEKLVPIYALNNERKIKNSSMQELFRIRTIKVLRGNFSAVDLGEEPCNNGLPEKGKLTERDKKETNNKTVWRAAKEKAAVLQAGQRKTLPFRRAFVFFCHVLMSWLVGQLEKA